MTLSSLELIEILSKLELIFSCAKTEVVLKLNTPTTLNTSGKLLNFFIKHSP